MNERARRILEEARANAERLRDFEVEERDITEPDAMAEWEAQQPPPEPVKPPRKLDTVVHPVEALVTERALNERMNEIFDAIATLGEAVEKALTGAEHKLMKLESELRSHKSGLGWRMDAEAHRRETEIAKMEARLSARIADVCKAFIDNNPGTVADLPNPLSRTVN